MACNCSKRNAVKQAVRKVSPNPSKVRVGGTRIVRKVIR